MNEEVIMGMVQPYLKNNSLLYSEFEKIFNMLSVKEQISVSDILDRKGITILEESDDEDIQNFEILYDESIFDDDIEESSSIQAEESSQYLRINKKVHQSNEILCVLIQNGDMQAKQDLCTKNEGLVRSEVTKYARYLGHDLEYDELLQVGMIGMLRAAEKFEIERGLKFSTYALWWIRQAIIREIGDHGFTIRVPIHRMDQIARISRLERICEMKGLDYYDRIKAISEESGLDEETVEYCMMIRSHYLKDVSLDTPVGEEQESTLSEYVPDNYQPSVENAVENNALKEAINDVLDQLTERERDIIELRFGLNGREPHTLEAVGQAYNVTRERIRQIESKAVRKMRNPSRARMLRDFYEE